MDSPLIAVALPPLLIVPAMGILSRIRVVSPLQSELRRKTLHILTGLLALGLPFVLRQPAAVLGTLLALPSYEPYNSFLVPFLLAVGVLSDQGLTGAAVDRDQPSAGDLDDHRPVAVVGHRVLPELANRARLDLDQLLQPVGQTAEARLEDAERLGVLEAARDQLFLAIALEPGAPQR